MACLSVLLPIFCNTHIRLAGSVVSFWHALSLASRFPIRPATSLCLSAVSPCPSFPQFYKRPISALLRLPPCPAFFCSPILAPSPLFCLFAKHFHTAAYPRSPAVVFSPLARPLLLSLSVAGFLPQTLSVLLLFCLTDAFPICSLLMPPFKALFFLFFALVSLCRFTFALSFNARFLLHFSQKRTSRLATLTAAPVCFYPFSFFSHALFFWHVYLALPCPNKAQRVFVSLFLSAFLPGCLLLSTLALAKPFSPGIPPNFPPPRLLFAYNKTGAAAGFVFSL